MSFNNVSAPIIRAKYSCCLLYSIGSWVQRELSISVDEYETHRPPRRERTQMQMPPKIRQEKLMKDWNISFSLIRKTARDVSKDRESRSKTNLKYLNRKSNPMKKLLSSCRGDTTTNSHEQNLRSVIAKKSKPQASSRSDKKEKTHEQNLRLLIANNKMNNPETALDLSQRTASTEESNHCVDNYVSNRQISCRKI